MEQLMEWLLNQSGVAVVMGIVIYFQQKEKQDQAKEHKIEREALQKQIEKFVDQHKEELKKLNDDAKKEALENLKTMKNFEVLVESVDEGIEEILALLTNKN